MKPIDINFAGGRLRSLCPPPDQQYHLTKAIVLVGLACLLWLGSNLVGNLIESQRLAETTQRAEHALQSKQIAAAGPVQAPLSDRKSVV